MKPIITIFVFTLIIQSSIAQTSEFSLIHTGFSGPITSFAEDTSGNIWAAIRTGFSSEDTVEIVLMNENIIDTIFIPTAYAIYGIDVDQQNNLWIATQDTGLVKFDGNDLTFINLQPIFTVTPQHNQAYCVQIDNENNIWIGAIGGLAKYDGQNWTVYDHLNSPLQYWPDIWSIKFDSQNNLWFGHYYGAGRLSNNIWTFWYNSPFDYLMTVAIAKDGIVWLGPSWGFAVELSNDLTWNSLDFLILPNSTHQIAVDTNNVKWFGKFDSDENIIAYNGSYFNPLIIPHYPELQTAILISIYADKQNNKWFGFYNGLLVKYSGDFPTGIGDETEITPDKFYLYQNYPNPFNPTTKIKYSIPSVISIPTSRERNLKVSLKVYDVLGNEVATLVNEEKPAGTYEVEFSASKYASGVNFYQLSATGGGGNYLETKKMILIK